MNIDVDFYELPDGNEPVREFLDSLDVKMRAKMYREIDLLVINGPELREPQESDIDQRIFKEDNEDSKERDRIGKKIP